MIIADDTPAGSQLNYNSQPNTNQLETQAPLRALLDALTPEPPPHLHRSAPELDGEPPVLLSLNERLQLHHTTSLEDNQPRHHLHDSDQHSYPKTVIPQTITNQHNVLAHPTLNGDLTFDQTTVSFALADNSALDGDGLETQCYPSQSVPHFSQPQHQPLPHAHPAQYPPIAPSALDPVATDPSNPDQSAVSAINSSDELARLLFPTSSPDKEHQPDHDVPDLVRHSQKENAPSSRGSPRRHPPSPHRQHLGPRSLSPLEPSCPQSSAQVVQDQLLSGKRFNAAVAEDEPRVLVPNSSSVAPTTDGEANDASEHEPEPSSAASAEGAPALPTKRVIATSPSKRPRLVMPTLEALDPSVRSPIGVRASPVKRRATVQAPPQAKYQSAADIPQKSVKPAKRRRSDFDSEDDPTSDAPQPEEADGSRFAAEDDETADSAMDLDGDTTLTTMPRPTAERTADMSIVEDEDSSYGVVGRILPPTQPPPMADETQSQTVGGGIGPVVPDEEEVDMLDTDLYDLNNSQGESYPPPLAQQQPRPAVRFESHPRISDMIGSQSQQDAFNPSQFSLPGATQPHQEIEHLKDGRGAYYISTSEPTVGSLGTSSGNQTQLEPTQLVDQSLEPIQIVDSTQLDAGGEQAETQLVATQTDAEEPAADPGDGPPTVAAHAEALAGTPRSIFRQRAASNNSVASKRSRQSSSGRGLRRITFDPSPPIPVVQFQPLVEQPEEIPPSPSQLIDRLPEAPQSFGRLPGSDGLPSPAAPGLDGLDVDGSPKTSVGPRTRGSHSRAGQELHPLAREEFRTAPGGTQQVDETVVIDGPVSEADESLVPTELEDEVELEVKKVPKARAVIILPICAQRRPLDRFGECDCDIVPASP